MMSASSALRCNSGKEGVCNIFPGTLSRGAKFGSHLELIARYEQDL